MKTVVSEKAFLKLREISGFDQLGTRERTIVAVGIVFILVVLVYHFLVGPYLDARKKLMSSIASTQKELVTIRQLQEEYGELRKQEGGIKANLAKRDRGFTLFTFLDAQAAAADVKKQIKYMKPSEVEGDGNLTESMVEMKLEKVDLPHLVEFLKNIESDADVVSIRRLSIQTSGEEQGMLDVILQIVTFIEGE